MAIRLGSQLSAVVVPWGEALGVGGSSAGRSGEAGAHCRSVGLGS